MRRQIPTIQAPVQPAATAPTAATAVTVIMVHLMYLYLQASTEAAKPAHLVPTSLRTPVIRVTAAQRIPVHGLAHPVIIRAAAAVSRRTLTAMQAM